MNIEKKLEEFSKKWREKDEDGFGYFYGMLSGGKPVYDYLKIEDFIRQALTEQKADLIEEIEKIEIAPEELGEVCLFDDIINLIKKQ